MGYEFKTHSIGYKAIEPAELIAADAEYVIGRSRMVKVIRHRARVEVEYLVEMPDGTRQWETANSDASEAKLDECSRCHGMRGGVKGNENVVNGVLLCDHCSADDLQATR
jgi:hypothetical protein